MHACVCFRVTEGGLVSFSLLRLLHCLLSKSSPVSVVAHMEIQTLASARNLKLQSFFNQYRNPVCQVRLHLHLIHIMYRHSGERVWVLTHFNHIHTAGTRVSLHVVVMTLLSLCQLQYHP